MLRINTDSDIQLLFELMLSMNIKLNCWPLTRFVGHTFVDTTAAEKFPNCVNVRRSELTATETVQSDLDLETPNHERLKTRQLRSQTSSHILFLSLMWECRWERATPAALRGHRTQRRAAPWCCRHRCFSTSLLTRSSKENNRPQILKRFWNCGWSSGTASDSLCFQG